ncbi:MAG TPA: HNH endonuclease signature motif containing protein [Noviherbaspirillum sp.]|nr:HNH endonuclease signature motif containing protein [Noviherbaspirillum sp.]
MAGSKNGHGYILIGLPEGRFRAHRLAWLYVCGEWPKNEVDHINGVRSDNRIANLRDVSRRTNNENRREAQCNNRSSGLLGVTWSGRHKKWAASIRVNRKNKHLGLWETKEEAHEAYVCAKRRLHEGCML